jgi:uncharacterized protein YehS (DUF1456 family)
MFDLPIDYMVHKEAYPGCAFGAYEWFETLKDRHPNLLKPGEYLLPNQTLASRNYHLRYQLDGNISVYETETMKLKWQIITPLEKGGKFIFNLQSRALQLYDADNYLVWQIDTNRKGNSVKVSEAGELVFEDSSGNIIKKINHDIFIKFNAAFKATNGKTYIFMGDEYLRYSDGDCTNIDNDFPRNIKGNWGNIPESFNESIDAIFVAPNNKTYIFKGDQYLRYSDGDCTKVDNGFPRAIKGNWGNIPESFNESIDAIFVAPNNKTYIFKGDQYLRYSDGDCTKVDNKGIGGFTNLNFL